MRNKMDSVKVPYFRPCSELKVGVQLNGCSDLPVQRQVPRYNINKLKLGQIRTVILVGTKLGRVANVCYVLIEDGIQQCTTDGCVDTTILGSQCAALVDKTTSK